MSQSPKFVHLHAHSHYSLLDGLGKVSDMVNHVKSQGMDALALTDHGVLYGAIDFYETAKEAGIKPIIGYEAYVARGSRLSKTAEDTNPYHLILLAKNKTGYQNLLKLVTEAHLTGFYYKPRIDWELLEQHHEGLICTSACLASETSQAILRGDTNGAKETARRYAELFGEGNYYLELQHHPNIPEQAQVNEELKKMAAELHLPLVATNDAHYVAPTDAEAQDVLLCIQTGKQLSDTDRMNMTSEDFSLKSPQEMYEAFADTPEAVENTVKIAEQCSLELDLGGMILPKFTVPEGFSTEADYLRRLVYAGMVDRYGTAGASLDLPAGSSSERYTEELHRHGLSQEMIDRLDYEMGVIEKMGYESYFLIVADFVNWAKQQGIVVGPGRGSAAGSIVAYVLRITNLDPLEFGLLFERFLNPDRISMPDIDLDFADDRRQEVIEYVANKYGKDHVAQIITFGTLGAKAAVRDTGRVMGMLYGRVDEVCKLIPGKPGTKLVDVRKQSDIAALERDDGQVKRLLELAQRLEGSNRHASTHAAGVVISDAPLVTYVPLQYATRDDSSVVTQYSMFPIERVGLLKMDFLGLANLTILRTAVEIVAAVYGDTIDIDALPLDDAKTYELLADAQTHGVFQLESDGMRRYIRELRPNRFEDIVAMVALYRPGPMQFIDSFIKRKHGVEPVKYIHPKVENSLAETYGIMVYQEQVMQISKDVAGFTGGEADTLRKAVGKKIASLMAKMRPKFVEGVVQNGESRQLGETLFDQFEAFANYGFNKAHAACYALIAYQTAYLKAHYPSAFMAALLTSEQENLDKLTAAINDAEALGIEVLPPDVNESFADFAVAPDKRNIRFGLNAIKNVGRNTVEGIIASRKADGPFTSITNFLKRLPDGSANRKSLESLIKAGALDSLADRGQMLAGLEAMARFSAMRAAESRTGQVSLFGEGESIDPDLDLPPGGTVDTRQKLEWERELLGMYVSEHPLDSQGELLEGYTPKTTVEGLQDGATVDCAGIVTIAKKITTRKGDPMAFVTLEDTTGQLEIIVFPKLYNTSLPLLTPGILIAVTGKVSRKDGEVKVLADTLLRLEEAPRPKNRHAAPQDPTEKVQPPADNRTTETHQTPVRKQAAEAVATESETGVLTIELFPETTLDVLEQIKTVLQQHHGESPVTLVVPQNGERKSLRLPTGVRISEELLGILRAIDTRAAVDVA